MVFLSGCLCNQPTTTDDGGTDSGRCNRPYIQVGGECCLDRDGNDICDKDEVTTTEAPTTTAAPKTTQPTTTQAPQTTTTTIQVTTTLAAIACAENRDCGQVINYTKCYNGNVIMYWETPTCTKPGKPDAQCVMKSKTTAYQACGPDEKCLNAKCENVSLITCGDACLDKGYTGWYCNSDAACTGSDVRADLGDIACSPSHTDGYCCCKSETLTETPSSTTTTTLSGATHKICSGTSCVSVAGPGINLCSSNLDCGGSPTPTHWECNIFKKCVKVSGFGLNTCTSNAQCLLLPKPTTTTTLAGLKVYHNECSIFNKCVKVVGLGIDQCDTNFDCLGFRLPTTTTLFHLSPGITLSPGVTLPPVVTLPGVVTTIPQYIPPGGLPIGPGY